MLDPSILQIFTTAGIAMFQPRRDYSGFRPQRTATGWLIPPGIFVLESTDAAVVLRWAPGDGGLTLSEHKISELRYLLSGPVQTPEHTHSTTEEAP